MLLYIIYFILLLMVIIKITNGWCYSKTCLTGKTAIITGGNSGIGFEIALALASRGCKIIIADKDDGAESRNIIITKTGNKNILTKKMDLASFNSVRKFVEYIKQTEPRIDILINNAGIGTNSMVFTEDNYHRTMQVNYLGHFLLTYLLLDNLKKSAPSRIVFTSSMGAFFTKLKFKDINPRENDSETYRTYLNSKLCEALATKSFAEKIKDSKVTVNCFHPGGVRTGIFQTSLREKISFLPLVLGLLTIPFGKSPEEGAQTGIYLAIDKKVENITGGYFIDCRQFLMPFQTYNQKFCQEVFEYSKELVRLKPEECSI